MNDDIDLFCEALEMLRLGRAPNPAACRWLCDAMSGYASGEFQTLEAAMGLSVGPGGARRRLPILIIARRRDRAIRALGDLITGAVGQKAAIISKAACNPESVEFKRLPTQAQQMLLRLLSEYANFPTSRQQLDRILRGDSVALRVDACPRNTGYSSGEIGAQ